MYTILVGCPASCGCYCVCVLSRRAGSIMQLFIHSTFERPGGFGQHHQLVYVKVAACLVRDMSTNIFTPSPHGVATCVSFSSQTIVWQQGLMVTCAANLAITSTPRF